MSKTGLASSKEIEAATRDIGKATKSHTPQDNTVYGGHYAVAGGRKDACFRCRLRKLRCDGQRPACTTCVRLGSECGGYYEPPSKVKQRETAARLLGITRSSKIEHPDAPIKPPLHADKAEPPDWNSPDSWNNPRSDQENSQRLAYRTPHRSYVQDLKARLEAMAHKLPDSSTNNSTLRPSRPAGGTPPPGNPSVRQSSVPPMLTPVSDDEVLSDSEDEDELREHDFESTTQSGVRENAEAARKNASKSVVRRMRQSERNDHQHSHPTSLVSLDEPEQGTGQPFSEALPSIQAKQHSPPFGSQAYRSSSESEISFVRGHDQSHAMGWSEEQWNEPTQHFIETFASTIIQRYVLAVKKSTEQASDVSSSRNTASPSKSTTTPSSGTGTSSRKRPRRGKDNGQDAEDDEGDDGRSPGGKRLRGGEEPVKLFACPYAKHDPSRYSEQNQEEKNYRGCASKYLNSVSRVKQHLYRVHARPHWYCGNCYVDFPTRERLNDHHRQRPPCDVRPARFDEMMTDEQYTQIKRKGSGKTPRDAWYSIFHILFPGSEPPVSSYVSTSNPETLRHFVTFFRAFGPTALSNLMRESAERNGGPIALEASTQTVVDEAFEIALPEVLRQRDDSALDMHIASAGRESGSSGSVVDAGSGWNLWASEATAGASVPLSRSPNDDNDIVSWDPLNPAPASTHAEFDAGYVYVDANPDTSPRMEAADGAFSDFFGDWHQSGW